MGRLGDFSRSFSNESLEAEQEEQKQDDSWLPMYYVQAEKVAFHFAVWLDEGIYPNR